MSIDVRAPAYKILADDLRTKITSGQLRPGDRLPTEPQLCRSSGVSRSTVREALRLLASQNLIVTTRGVAGGSFVVHPSPAQLAETLTIGITLLGASAQAFLRDFLEARAVVEVPAAGFAASRRSEQDLAALRAAMLDVDADPDANLATHLLFHEALADACGNPVLAVITKPLHRVTHARETLRRLDTHFWTQVDSDHQAILAAVAGGRADEAKLAAAVHLDNLKVAVEQASDCAEDASMVSVAGAV